MHAALAALWSNRWTATNDWLAGWRLLWRGPTALTWHDAEAYCEDRGGELIKAESKAMQGIFMDTLMCRFDGCWLGLRPCDNAYTACDSLGAWRWKDGSPCESKRSYFAAGEPNASPKPYVSCVVGGSLFDGLWDDISCSDPMYPVCQTREGFFPVFLAWLFWVSLFVLVTMVTMMACYVLHWMNRRVQASRHETERDPEASEEFLLQTIRSAAPPRASEQTELRYDAFLAHSWQSAPDGPNDTHDLVTRIAGVLDRAHHLDCWNDAGNIAYRDYTTAMYNGIRTSKIFVAFATREYLRKANSSERSHVKDELEYAIGEKDILWVMLEPGLSRFADADWGALLMRAGPRRHLYVDFVDVSEQAFAGKVEELAASINNCIAEIYNPDT